MRIFFDFGVDFSLDPRASSSWNWVMDMKLRSFLRFQLRIPAYHLGEAMV